jgi:hypothetical protein
VKHILVLVALFIVDRRARTFANTPWRSCQLKEAKATISDHRSNPPGCEILNRY